ncbi:protein ESMERALDA 1-like isoform X2 [Phoenix dactylifera]|uniref:O-fucosyltransferase family protein n=1 Tax=Phoenix dactylifera TaxID=42345 RepID=A0A8B9AAM1_PHODC|nr:protein ESMERALDA 1-like isoform X2 [Phoenix dactylifera]
MSVTLAENNRSPTRPGPCQDQDLLRAWTLFRTRPADDIDLKEGDQNATSNGCISHKKPSRNKVRLSDSEVRERRPENRQPSSRPKPGPSPTPSARSPHTPTPSTAPPIPALLAFPAPKKRIRNPHRRPRDRPPPAGRDGRIPLRFAGPSGDDHDDVMVPHHAYNRLGSGGTTPSPPASPRRSPRIHRRTSKSASGRALQAPRTLLQRLAWMVLSLLLRRQAIFLFAPLLYVAGMLFYMGTVSLEGVPRIISRPAPGSIYRSPQLYQRLRPDMDSDNSSDALAAVWRHPYKGGTWRPCINVTMNELPDSNGYIYVEANGGLNQQRTSICNAVAVAGYLNATLVIPNFHYHSIWRDPSKFKDIYDEEHFINTLKNDVRVVDKVPDFIMERFGHNMSNVHNFKIKAWSSIQYYKDAVLPKLIEEKFIRISPFANRLSFDAPSAVQHLRCLANFEALHFSNPIATLAEKLISRMKERSTDNNGRYIAVHLRFEEDMVAFSCCIFDGGEEEKQDMNAARERGWRGKFTKRGRVIRPGVIRMNGKCPLTPLEVGLMLRGMGFSNNTSIYLASGKIYKAEKTMAPLLEMFPLLQTKETLASPEELAPFKLEGLEASIVKHAST